MSNSSFGLPWPGAGEQFLLRPDVAFLKSRQFRGLSEAGV